MRKIFRTAVSLAMGCALLSTSAFAAGVGNVNYDEVTKKLSIGITTASGDEQVAVVVVKGDSENLTIDENAKNIVYIDQQAAANGALNLTGIDIGDATAVSVFAGYASNTTDKAVYMGGAKSSVPTIEIAVGSSTEGMALDLGIGAKISYKQTDVTGEPTWTVTKGEETLDAAKYIKASSDLDGYIFKADAEGTYKVKAAIGTVSSNELTFTVTKADVKMVAGSNRQTAILTSEELKTDNLYGFGAAMKINVPSSITLQKMIWVLDAKLGNDETATRKFSESVDISKLEAVSGDISVAATFAAGAANDVTKAVKSVDAVNALFLDSNGIEYSTIDNFDFDGNRAN